MEVEKNVLEKWLEFREEELETLSDDDKKHIFDFENCVDMILNCVNGEIYMILLRKNWRS